MSVSEITVSVLRLDQPPSRRFTRLFSSLLSAREAPLPHAAGGTAAAEPEAAPLELAEREATQGLMSAIVEHSANRDWVSAIANIPGALVPAPGRIVRAAHLDAAGFADRASESVGVDLACWRRPPGERVDACAWRRVFTWIVVADNELSKVVVLTPPAPQGGGISASYGYEAEGVPGVGVLHLAPLPAGCWRIVDCWGDATDAARVRELATALV